MIYFDPILPVNTFFLNSNKLFFDIEGEWNIPLPNISLWSKNCFRLIIFKKWLM